MPAEAGIQFNVDTQENWIPAYAGMTISEKLAA
jgi:hypothetical protein